MLQTKMMYVYVLMFRGLGTGGAGGPGPPLGVENTPKGAKEAARGSSIR